MNNDTDKQLERITEGIKNIINNETNRVVYDDTKWKEMYNNTIFEIENEIESIKESIVDFNEDNLTFNKIEQEGYLRALITMLNRFNYNKQFINK